MNTPLDRPKALWTPINTTPSVNRYLNYYGNEFATDFIKPNYPYEGPASKTFRKISNLDYSRDWERRLEEMGNGCWAVRRDEMLNPLTADLLAAADLLGGVQHRNSSSAAYGGMGVDESIQCVYLLDGGVGVVIRFYEDDRTNSVEASEQTTIRGPRTYRVLTELLGFDWINRKLPEEDKRPTHEEIQEQVRSLLLKNNQ